MVVVIVDVVVVFRVVFVVVVVVVVVAFLIHCADDVSLLIPLVKRYEEQNENFSN